MSEADVYCEDLVRRFDEDRYLASVFAPAEVRPHLFALYAFNFEVAKTAETVSNPIAGQIRLQWWRDTIEGIFGGTVREHPVAIALAMAISARGLPRNLFDELIGAREADLETLPFANRAALERYADATSGNVMRLAARMLGAGDTMDDAARDAGIAYALVGLLRLYVHAIGHQRLVLPRKPFEDAGVTLDELASFSETGLTTARSVLRDVFDQTAGRAKQLVGSFGKLPRRFLPAVLPASLVRSYANAAINCGDPLTEMFDIPSLRKHRPMLWAMLRGRL